MKHIVLWVLSFFCFAVAQSQSLYLDVGGVVTFNDRSLLVEEAGNDLNATISTSVPVTISVKSNYYWNMRNERWRIYVHKSNIEWDSDIKLEVQRTGMGSKLTNNGKPKVYGGETYSEVANNPGYFFNGRGLIQSIPISFRIRNLSLTKGAGDFETDVVFTIYDD